MEQESYDEAGKLINDNDLLNLENTQIDRLIESHVMFIKGNNTVGDFRFEPGESDFHLIKEVFKKRLINNKRMIQANNYKFDNL